MSSSTKLEGRTAVVTGAGRGLGRAIAAALALEGITTWICARTDSELTEAAEQIQARIEARMAEEAEAEQAPDGTSEEGSGA